MKKTKTKAAASKASKSNRAASAKTALPNLKLVSGGDGLRQALAILRDSSDRLSRRMEALQVLQSASFGDEAFEDVRLDYIAALRELTADKEVQLRQRALGLLARSRDPYAEKVLMTGLKNPDKATVPPGDALNYLSYNLHSGVQSLARSIFDKSKDQSVRQQALRLMANDPKSLKTIQSTLDDKKEPIEVRQTSAEALHALNPKALQSWAAKAAVDKKEDPELLATSLNALSHFGDKAQISGNKALRKRIAEMSSGESPAKFKRIAKTISHKYGL
jgi:hypothetical protein